MKTAINWIKQNPLWAALIVITLGVITWYFWKKHKEKQKQKSLIGDKTQNSNKNSSKTTTASDSFPLHEGSKGQNVLLLQNALLKLGANAAKLTQAEIDKGGMNFGPLTLEALKEKYNVTTVDQALFARILTDAGMAVPTTDPTKTTTTDTEGYIKIGSSSYTYNPTAKKIKIGSTVYDLPYTAIVDLDDLRDELFQAMDGVDFNINRNSIRTAVFLDDAKLTALATNFSEAYGESLYSYIAGEVWTDTSNSIVAGALMQRLKILNLAK